MAEPAEVHIDEEPVVDLAEAHLRLRESRSAVLGTVDPEQGVHLVPVVYTTVGDDRIVIAVDSKPKRSRQLRRLANIERDSRVSLLVEHYEDDWRLLWWVRADGRATVRPSIDDEIAARHRHRYPQVQSHELGPWIDIEIGRLSGWSAGSRSSEPR